MLGNSSEAERLEASQEGVSALLRRRVFSLHVRSLLKMLSNAFKYSITQVKLKGKKLKR
jgi:hypothetical protein